MANPKFVMVCVMAILAMVYVVAEWEPARATFYGGPNGEETLRKNFPFYICFVLSFFKQKFYLF